MSFHHPLSCDQCQKWKQVKERQHKAFQSHVEHNRRSYANSENRDCSNGMQEASFFQISLGADENNQVKSLENLNFSLISSRENFDLSHHNQYQKHEHAPTPTSAEVFQENFLKPNLYDDDKSDTRDKRLLCGNDHEVKFNGNGYIINNAEESNFSLGNWLARNGGQSVEETTTNIELVSAIKRWQLRKGRMRPRAFTDTKFCAARYAGVDIDGNFVPLLQPFRYSWKGYLKDGINFSQWASFNSSKEFNEKRVVARCFLRLRKFAIQQSANKLILNDIKKSFSVTNDVFRKWLKAYHACKYYRLRTMSECYELWVGRVRNLAYKGKLKQEADQYFTRRQKRKVLKHFRQFATLSSFKRNRRNLAQDFLNYKVISSTFQLWIKNHKNAQLKTSAKRTSELHYSKVCCSKVFLLLRQHVNKVKSDRIRKLYMKQWKARQAIKKMESWTRKQIEWTTQMQGAALYFDLKHCMKIFSCWADYTSLKCKIYKGYTLSSMLKKRRALRLLGAFCKNKKGNRENQFLATTYREKKLKSKVFQSIMSTVNISIREKDAIALCDVHIMKRYFDCLRLVLIDSSCERLSISFWKLFRKRMVLNKLKKLVADRIKDKHRNHLSSQYLRSRKLSRYFSAWTQQTHNSIYLQAGTYTAINHARLRLISTTFAHWEEQVKSKNNLALAYKLTRAKRNFRTCFIAWKTSCLWYIETTEQFKNVEECMQNNKLKRLILAWSGYVTDTRMNRRALKMAALYRRQSLTNKIFTHWAEVILLKKSNEQVKKLAEKHSRYRIKKNSLRRWYANCDNMSLHQMQVARSMFIYKSTRRAFMALKYQVKNQIKRRANLIQMHWIFRATIISSESFRSRNMQVLHESYLLYYLFTLRRCFLKFKKVWEIKHGKTGAFQESDNSERKVEEKGGTTSGFSSIGRMKNHSWSGLNYISSYYHNE